MSQYDASKIGTPHIAWADCGIEPKVVKVFIRNLKPGVLKPVKAKRVYPWTFYN